MSDIDESTAEARPLRSDESELRNARGDSTPAQREAGIQPGYDELVSEAEAKVTVYTPAEAINLVDDSGVRFVDVRDADELSDGTIPGAIHASRGRLEAHLDPDTPRYVSDLDCATEIVFYCEGGGRSALAARRAQELGFDRVGHLAGGISAWKDTSGPVQDRRE